MSGKPIYIEPVEPISEINADTSPPRSKKVLVGLILSHLAIIPFWCYTLVIVMLTMGAPDIGSAGYAMILLIGGGLLLFPFIAAVIARRAYLNRENSKAVLWSVLLFIVPFLSILTYFLIGYLLARAVQF